MEISYDAADQYVLEEEYDENYEPTEKGEPNLHSDPVAMESVRLLLPHTQRYWSIAR